MAKVGSDGSSIYATVDKGVTNFLVYIDIKNKYIHRLTEDGKTVFSYLNSAGTSSLKIESEAFLVIPPGAETNFPLPTLAYMHGGPKVCVGASFSQLLSARSQSAAHWLALHGYAVFIPNYRGSSNYGPEFMNQLQDYYFTQTPHRDLLSGLDYLNQEGIADPDALGIYGHSWGGFQVTWAITHSPRFKGAAAAVGGEYDMLRNARQTGQSFLITPNRLGNADTEAMWKDPNVYRKFSPIEHGRTARTPILLIETCAEHNKHSYATSFFNGLIHNGVETYFSFIRPNITLGAGTTKTSEIISRESSFGSIIISKGNLFRDGF